MNTFNLSLHYRLILFLLLVSAGISAQTIHQNPYHLQLTSTVDEYQQLIKTDSSNLMADLDKVVPGLILDIRYATENNFTHTRIYTAARAYARISVAKALKKIQADLNKEGLGLKIFDAYRPYSATLLFYEVTRDTVYTAAPWKGSRHNRGCAVDVSLVDLNTGKELEMPTAYDDFTLKAHPDYPDLPTLVKKNRDHLIHILEKYGFTVYPEEWWHFDLKGWERYGLMDLSFDELNSSPAAF